VCGKNRMSLAVTQTLTYLLCTVPEKHHLLPEVIGSSASPVDGSKDDLSLSERIMSFSAFGRKVRCVSAWQALLTCIKDLDVSSRHFALKEMNGMRCSKLHRLSQQVNL